MIIGQQAVPRTTLTNQSLRTLMDQCSLLDQTRVLVQFWTARGSSWHVSRKRSFWHGFQLMETSTSFLRIMDARFSSGLSFGKKRGLKKEVLGEIRFQTNDPQP